MWRWTVLVFSLAIINHISAQDDNNRTETQTKLCCPCPPGWTGDTTILAAPMAPMDLAASTISTALSPVGGAPARAALDIVDDCPCRARDADSEGAASLFFPNAVRAFGNVMRPEPKEESKPLLHPEVDLASSVLETLREATDEEYRDALERDAARAAATDITALTGIIADGVPEEARNVVTVIVSPRDMETDDALPEASHVQETRCIHSPLGNPKASFILQPLQRTPQKGIEDILNLPLPGGLLHRQRDSNVAASNVQENIVRPDDSLNTILARLRLRTNNALNFHSKKIGENINNILNNANLGIKTGTGLDRRVNADSNTLIDSTSDQMNSEVDRDNNTTEGLEDSILNRQSDNQGELDEDSNALSTNNEQTLFKNNAKNTGLLKSLLQSRNNEGAPQNSFPLKNLLKLRDVELVPLDILKNVPQTKTKIPIIKMDPLQTTKVKNPIKLTTQSILLGKSSTITDMNDKINLRKSDNDVYAEKSTNIQTIPRRNMVTTDILDVLPSPSESNCITLKPEVDKSADVDMAELENTLLNASTIETDEELVSDVAKEGDDTNISEIGSVENVQLKSSELAEDNETAAIEIFEIINDTETPEQDGSSDIHFFSQDDMGDISPSAVELSEINQVGNRSNNVTDTPSSLKTLAEIRNSVVDKLNALQKSNRNALENIKHKVEEISQTDSIEEENQDTNLFKSEEQISNGDPTFESSSSPIIKELRDTSASGESVSFQDLQNMSDSILAASEKDKQRADAIDEGHIESKEDNSESEEVSESEIDNVLGMDESQLTEPNPKNNFHKNTEDTDEVNAKKALCPSDLFDTPDKNKLDKTSNNVTNNEDLENDLEPLASDPIMNILRPTSLSSGPLINILRPNSKSLVEHLNDFETKLRQSIVQPASLINVDDLNIFRTPSFSIPDISGLNTNIPTLDEIRSRVSEILSGLARSTNDDDSSEFDSDDFASDINPVVSTGPGSSNPTSILPPLRPLEDINLDIIQLKPLPSLLGSSPDLSRLPGLNLNRYKAKLAVPKSLDLKPLNLASTLGNDGGLVGATLSVGPERKGKTGKSKFNSNPDLVNMFRGAENNPTLAEITSSVHKNALNLLHIPKGANTPILQAENVVKNFADDLRSHTEDTIRSIHESLNPPSIGDIHRNLIKNANNLLTSGRNSFEKTLQASTPINAAVDNLRSQTENTIKQLHNTLQSSRVSDLSTAIQKNTNNILKSSRGSIDAAVDNLKAQSENNFRNIQQTFDTSSLVDISDSIHKSAQNILKSSSISPTRNVLGSTMQVIPPIDKVRDSLRSHTKNTLKNIQQTLNSPTLSDINNSLQKSANQIFKSPITNARAGNLKSALQPSMSIDTVVDNLKSQTQSTMRNIQNSLNTPTLADVSATVQKHTQNLLSSPAVFTGRDALGQILQPVNLAPHAEQIAKDLQKTLKATLKNSPIKDLPTLPHPNDVMEMISNHHEDVNDKLFAIQTDLNDRLETLHNEVTDPERLRSILSPLGNSNFELFAIPLPLGARSVPGARKQSRPTSKTKQPSFTTQRKQPKKITSDATKPRTEASKLGSMLATAAKEKSSPKSFRIPSAASSPVPTRISKPILPLTPKQFKGLQGIKPIFPAKNKVTVTFASTTPRSLAVSKSKEAPTTAKPKVSKNKRFKPKSKGPVRQPTPWNGWSGARSAQKQLEPLTSPSRSSNLRTPMKSKPVHPITKPLKTETSPSFSFPSPKLKSPSKPISKTPLTLGRASNPVSPLFPLNRPRSPFLSKLSDSLKNKTTATDLGASRKASNMQMAPAASDRFEKVVPLDEPLKENVPYKCKMMCVKVDLDEN